VIRTSHETASGVSPDVQKAALAIIAGGVILAVLYFGRVVFITTLVSIIIALILEPGVALFVRLRVPRVLATFMVCLIGIVTLYFAGLAAWAPVSTLSAEGPAFRQNLGDLIMSITNQVQDLEDSATRLVVPQKPAPPKAPDPPPATSRQRKSRTPDPLPAPAPGDSIQEVRIHGDRGGALAGFVFERLGSVYEFVLMA
jgi:hypothetical protein